MGAAIEVENVWKNFRIYHQRALSLKEVMTSRKSEYETFWALRDVSFEVPEGKMLGLIGTNGSGKSTMLKCLARILAPNSGEIRMHGKVSSLLELGTGFHPELSGRENLYLAGSILGLTKNDITARFDTIAEFAGIGDFIDMPVKNYSSGMYARLAFALAINVDAEILLVDEVLSVGDAAFQQRSYERITELLRGGSTIVFVSHALDAVRSLCDTVVWLQKGEKVMEGGPDEVVESYLRTIMEAPAAAAGISGAAGAAEVWTPPPRGSQAGSGEIRVRQVRFRGLRDEERDYFGTHEPVTVILDLDVNEARDDVAVTLSFTNTETNETINGICTDAGPGVLGVGLHHQRIEFRIEHLPLWSGTYDLTVGLHSPDMARVYDWHERRFNITVNYDGLRIVGRSPIYGVWGQG